VRLLSGLSEAPDTHRRRAAIGALPSPSMPVYRWRFSAQRESPCGTGISGDGVVIGAFSL
jgi:hypothetical protein